MNIDETIRYLEKHSDDGHGLKEVARVLRDIKTDEEHVHVRVWSPQKERGDLGHTGMGYYTRVGLPLKLLRHFVEGASKIPIIEAITNDQEADRQPVFFYRKPHNAGVDYDAINWVVSGR